MKKIITTDDVLALSKEGKTELVMNPGDRLTDLAREMVNRRNIRLVEASAIPAPAASVPIPTPIPAPIPVQAPVAASLSGRPAAPTVGADYDLVITGGTCVIPEMGCAELNVCVSHGKVVALTTETVRGRQQIDARGLYVLPGIIDPHTHIGLMVPFEQELETESRSAILGGVTTIGTYFNRTGSYLPYIEHLSQAIPQVSRVDVIPHFSLREQQQIDELPLYSQSGMNSYKVYMCGVPGLYPHQEDGFILRVMEKMKQLPPTVDPILSIHCENTSVCDYATEDMKDLRLETLDDWNRTHPNIAEGEAVIRAAYFSQKLRARTYVVHSSTKEAMEALRRLKHPNLYVETTSPYLCLDTKSDIGPYGKMLPPIREPESRKALWDGIRSGIIDTIGTDNTVMTAEEKKVAEGMRGAGPGYPTLGTHLPSVLNEGIFRQELPIEKLVPLMTMNPAKIFGVYPRKGTIMPGSDADIVLVDLRQEQVVQPDALLSRSDFSIFQGKRLRGWPVATIKGGHIAAWEGKLTDDTQRGRILKH